LRIARQLNVAIDSAISLCKKDSRPQAFAEGTSHANQEETSKADAID
jgi:hypothetical protein